jgi:alpha-L-fucosidase
MSKEAFESLHSVTALQPGIITNDRLGQDHPGDYRTFERTIPEQAPAMGDWEVCMPISGSWGYKKSDTDFKSPTTLVRNLADIASKGGNYLLADQTPLETTGRGRNRLVACSAAGPDP